MYAVYNYAAGSTQANVLADVVKILTGETNKANLSANCVQANTTITSTVAAGWTEYDAAAGTNTRCLRALNQDATTYKYYLLRFNSTTLMDGAIAEAWNNTAHTGTNVSSYYGATGNMDLTGGGYLYIYATAKNIAIMPWTATGYKDFHGLAVFEFTRETIPSGYPCAGMLRTTGIGSSATSGVIPRVKNNTATGDQTQFTSFYFSGLTGAPSSSAPGNTNQYYRDASENIGIALYRLAVADANILFWGLGYDVLLTGLGVASNLDEVVYSGTNYVVFEGSTMPAALAVPKA